MGLQCQSRLEAVIHSKPSHQSSSAVLLVSLMVIVNELILFGNDLHIVIKRYDIYKIILLAHNYRAGDQSGFTGLLPAAVKLENQKVGSLARVLLLNQYGCVSSHYSFNSMQR